MAGMQFSIRWMLPVTTFIACAAAAISLGNQGSLVGFWLMLVAMILMSHFEWHPQK
jgi:hypothetical protein